MAGNTKITLMVLITAPLESRVQMALIISMLEYADTPKVTAKKLSPLMIIDFIDALWAISMDSFFPF